MKHGAKNIKIYLKQLNVNLKNIEIKYNTKKTWEIIKEIIG